MSTQSARYKWTVPTDTDRFRNGAAAMRALAASIETTKWSMSEWISITAPGLDVVSGSWRTCLFDTATLNGSATRQALATVDAAGPNIPDNYPGLYLVTLAGTWPANTTGRRIFGVSTAQNTSPSTSYQAAQAPAAGVMSQVATLQFSQGGPGSRLCFNLYQDSGVTLSMTAMRLTVTRLTSTA